MTTNWACSAGQQNGVATASLTVSTNGGPPTPFKLKGVCYSPCPINGSNKSGPAIGDWFWDTVHGDGWTVGNWNALFARDLPNLRLLGVNTVRLYCMLSRQMNGDGSLPNPWNGGLLWKHTQFLDLCWNGGQNPIYVMVGLPMPDTMFWKSKYDEAKPATLAFWAGVFSETVSQLAAHPAVMGFTIQNELDGTDVTRVKPDGSNRAAVDFWWGQVEKLSSWAKTAMGSNSKIVGMANHDDPGIPGKAASYMAQCPSMDFWGVNTYQTETFESIFYESGSGPGYSGVTGPALKPVILTEWGIPATTRADPNQPLGITSNAETVAKTAAVIAKLAPQAFKAPMSLGLYYFEYCDEWWNQPPGPPDQWYGGPAVSQFPNGYWDNDGFGLWQSARGGNLKNNDPIWNGPANQPALPVDVKLIRTAMVDALKQSWPQ